LRDRRESIRHPAQISAAAVNGASTFLRRSDSANRGFLCQRFVSEPIESSGKNDTLSNRWRAGFGL